MLKITEPIRRILLMLGIFYVSFTLLLFIFQRDLLYFPTPKSDHPYQSQIFHNEGESIDVIVLNKEQGRAILFFGGNGESVVYNASDYLNNFTNHAIYLVNYRRYGGSSGYPEEQALYSDALHIYDTIKNKHDSISVIGRSLGTGIATYVASKRDVEKMVLITPYDSIENLAKSKYPIFPVSLLLQDKYDSLSRVKNIQSQTLILLAEHDNVVPLKHSVNLIKAFPASVVTAKIIKGTGHNSISNKLEFHALLGSFMY